MPTASPTGRTAAAHGAVTSTPSVENFDRVVDDYQRRLYGFALRMTGNREDAEEIVQDAFVRAYRALGKMSPEQRADLRLQPWLYTITLNVTRNRLRSKRPANVALDALADPDALLRESNEGPPQPERIVEQNAEIALVERALLQLPMHLARRGHPTLHRRTQSPGDCRDSQPADRNGEVARSSSRTHLAAHSWAADRKIQPRRSSRSCVVVTSMHCGMSFAASARPR